jgi:hypothetical protein
VLAVSQLSHGGVTTDDFARSLHEHTTCREIGSISFQRRMNSYSSVYVESVKGWMDASEPRFVETVCKMEKEKQQCKWIGKA